MPRKPSSPVPPKAELQRVLRREGSLAATGRFYGVPPSRVNYWVHKLGVVPNQSGGRWSASKECACCGDPTVSQGRRTIKPSGRVLCCACSRWVNQPYRSKVRKPVALVEGPELDAAIQLRQMLMEVAGAQEERGMGYTTPLGRLLPKPKGRYQPH